jgi:GntR family transcriptional regulator
MTIHHELPIYIQITESIRQEIISGALPPHSKLPSEHELVKMYGVARATVRRALAKLQEEGLIYARRAVGSFVAEPKIDQDLDRLFSFSEFMIYRGMKPGSRLLSAEIQRIASVDSPLLSYLHLKLGEQVIFISRLRLGSGQPLVIANTYLPELLFPGFLEHDIQNQSVYQIMETYGLKPTRAIQTFEAVALKQQEADLLGLPAGAPALLITRIGSAGLVPVEYAIDYYRGDRTRFRAHLADKPEKRKLHVRLEREPNTQRPRAKKK